MRTMRHAMQISGPPTLAALNIFICSRLLPELRTTPTEDAVLQAWLEKATITFIMFVTSPSQGKAGRIDTSVIKELLDEIHGINQIVFSAKATHAAQTLLWKAANSLGTWASCQLLQHPLFFHAGHMNKARIGR